MPSWCLPPKTLTLGANEVHVWRAALVLTTSHVQSFQHSLAPDELRRAERYFFQRDRDAFIIGRGCLRNILARYLQIDPGHLQFRYGAHGKPALAGNSEQEELCFNVSHSYGLALYAVTRGRQIGVDIERIRSGMAYGMIVERFFSAWEVATLRALPPDLQTQAFFDCWTRKEAYVKARGEGLTFSLNQFDVSLAPEEPAALLRVNGAPQESSRWSLLALDPGLEYAAALVVEGREWDLKCYQWAG